MLMDLPKGTTPQPNEVVRKFMRDAIDLAEQSGMPFGQCLITFGLIAKSIAKMYTDNGTDEDEAMHYVVGFLMEGLGFSMQADDQGQVH
jgi:hypothetical protein